MVVKMHKRKQKERKRQERAATKAAAETITVAQTATAAAAPAPATSTQGAPAAAPASRPTDFMSANSRVLVDYKHTLYKATVKKIRMKNGAHECLVHYDGNKKSTVSWIRSKMVRHKIDNDNAPVEINFPLLRQIQQKAQSWCPAAGL